VIRSTKHYLQDCNSGKKEIISSFLKEYRFAVQSYIDYIWSNKLLDHNGRIIWSINDDLLFLPKFLDYKIISHDKLSARALSAALSQAIGIVKGRVSIRNKILYIIKKRKEENKSSNYWESKLEKLKLTKPIIGSNFQAELSQKQIEIRESSNHFNLFIKLYGTGFDIVKIPIKYHKQDQKWISSSGKRLAGVLIKENCIQLRYEVPVPTKKVGKTVGGDTGLKTALTLSNGHKTPEKDNHGHSLDSICNKIAKKKKGSKAFNKAQDHRMNFINWSINQLNWKDIGQVNLEHVYDIKRGKRTSRKMSAWSNLLIHNKITKVLEEVGVQLNLQSSPYRSQRCSGCGIVRKANRKGKEYKCKECKLHIDADLNAALNHEIDLPEIRFYFRQYLSKLSSFYWKSEGLFDNTGQELRVPGTNKN
jgi:transposase